MRRETGMQEGLVRQIYVGNADADRASRVSFLQRPFGDISDACCVAALSLESAGEMPSEKGSQRVIECSRGKCGIWVADDFECIRTLLSGQFALHHICNLGTHSQNDRAYGRSGSTNR